MNRLKMMKSKTLLNWMKSFFIVILLLFALIAVLTSWMIERFTSEIIKLNFTLTSVIQSNLDTRFAEIEKTSLQIQLNPTNLALSNSSTPSDISSSSQYQLAKQMKNYKASNRFIQNIYAYYPKMDYIVGDIGCFSAREYYILYNELSSQGYSQWIAGLKPEQGKSFSFRIAEDGTPVLCFGRRIPYNQTEAINAIIVFEIAQSEILNALYTSEDSQSEPFITVMNSENQVFAHSENYDEQLMSAIPVEFFVNDGIETYHEYFVITQISPQNQLKYITIVNKNDTLAMTHLIRNITVAALCGFLFLGLGLASYMSLKNSRPLHNMLLKLPFKPEPGGQGMIDELSIIGSEIESMVHQSHKAKEQLDDQQLKIEELFLANILSSEQHSEAEIANMLLRYDLVFELPLYQVIVVRGVNDKAEEKDLWGRLLESLRTHRPYLYLIGMEYEGDCVLLLNLDVEYQTKVLEEITAQIQATFGDKARCIICIGRGYDAMSGVLLSYHQALQAIQQNNGMGGGVYVYRKSSAFTVPTASAGYSYMQQFEYAMLDENYTEAILLVDPLFKQYFTECTKDYIVRCKRYAVVNLLVEAINKTDQRFRKEYFFDLVFTSKEPEVLKSTTLLILNEIVRNRQSDSPAVQANNSLQLAQRAKQLIDQNFTNPLIGLYWISEQLEVSNTHLSTTFKQTFGEGVVSCINRLRIEKSKQLLASTELSIKAIASDVGFSGDISFIRVFKKHEGIPPGRFREL